MKKILALFFILSLYPFLILATDRVEINSASLGQLDKLKGIGPALGQRIIDARPYSSIDDLLKVKGIGEKTLQDIKDQGLAYVGNPSAEPVALLLAPPSPPEVIYPNGIFFNEILPSPKGADETDEWFELYNSNNFDVDLSGWQIKDSAGTITAFKIPPNTTILANNYLVFKRPDTKIMLNNGGDGLSLLNPDKSPADKIDFTKAPTGQSYNRIIGTTPGSWAWSAILTPNSKNIISTPVLKDDSKTLPKEDNFVKNKDAVAGLANLNQEDNSTTNPWFLFFTVLSAIIILAGVTLFIKFRLYRNKEEPRPLEQ